jgi:hypothetical protein
VDLWRNLGGTFITSPRAANVGGNRIALFGIGLDHQIYVKWRESGEWGHWQPLGGSLLTRPAVVSRDSRSLEVFCVSHDQSVCYRSWQGEWGAWRPLYGRVGGGEYLSPPTALVINADDLVVFKIGQDFIPAYKGYHNGEWEDWGLVGDTKACSCTAVASGACLHLFCIGSDRILRHALRKNGEWPPWTMIGGQQAISSATAVMLNEQLVEVFYVLTDRSLSSQSWNGAWCETTSLEGTILEPPTVIASEDARIDIFVVGEDRAIWHRCRVGDSSTWWRSLGGQAFGPVDAIRQGSNRIELFILGRDSAMWHRTFVMS